MSLFERVKQNEGFSATPYLCPAGRVTIGAGCNLEVNYGYIPSTHIAEAVRDGRLKGQALLDALELVGMEWTEQKADEVLNEHLNLLAGVLFSVSIPWAANLNETRRGVLVEMAYQMGLAGLLGFKKMLAAVQEGRWEDAEREGLWNAPGVPTRWHAQTPERAERLMEILKDGSEF